MIGSWGVGGVRVKIKDGWEDAGKEGEAEGYVQFDRHGSQRWIIVLWDGEDDPETFKAAGLMFKHLGKPWKNNDR
jgi:hypothetical protein